jgi:hypothetical protein
MDDWIPCEGQGMPTFETSRKGNELWVSILENSHVKLHGSYEALEGGVVHDAFIDLTRGAGEKIDTFHESSQLDFVNGHLWFQLQIFKQEGFLLKASNPQVLMCMFHQVELRKAMDIPCCRLEWFVCTYFCHCKPCGVPQDLLCPSS